MKILKLLSSLLVFAALIACEDLPFTDEDISPKTREESSIKTGGLSPANEQAANDTQAAGNETALAETPDNETEEEKEKEIPEEEITTISEDMELTEDTVIQNTRVVLDMASIKTGEHDLVIIADEFISNHSVIQNFPLEQKAEKETPGRNGGNILIEAKTASGTLQLILNGEDAGPVPKKRNISREERIKLSGRSGRDGKDAAYRKDCEQARAILPFHRRLTSPAAIQMEIIRRSIAFEGSCPEECAVPPTEGQASSNGRQGLPGFDGLKGGNSGSFHLKAIHLSDFQLTKIQNIPGLGSKGGRGSAGGYPGEPGKNGRDPEELCGHKYNFPRLARRGEKGNRGPKGKDGENGEQGTVCLESPIQTQDENLAGNEQNKGNVICY